MAYVISAHFDRGVMTYTANSEEDALALMDELFEGDIPYEAKDADGAVVDENDITDRMDARSAD
jgi:hypothetical protein